MAATAPGIWVSSRQTRVDLHVDGDAVVNHEGALRSFLSARAGEDAANLFAIPRSEANGDISWADPLGATQTRALGELPDAERKAAEEQLRAHLRSIEPLQGDPKTGAALCAALLIEGPDAIRVAGVRPIIAGWGAIPPNLTTADEMRRHHERTLGPFFALTDPPVPRLDDHNVAAIVPATAAVRRVGLAPLLATLAAATVLLLLLLPGVLRANYPVGGVPPTRGGADVTRALENEISSRQRQLEGNVCTFENGAAPRVEQRSAIDLLRPKAAPDQPAQLTPPVRPERTPVPHEALPSAEQQAARPSSLAQLAQDATVLVWTENGFGSGFFISPVYVLTNRHVIENSRGEIRMGNRKLGRMMQVEQVAMSSNSALGQPDYALLKLKEGQSAAFFSMVQEIPSQLQNVIAAGYPGIVVDTDINFERLRHGDAAAVPDIALTDGTVVVVQNSNTSTPVILHRASISPGSSGGPLIDECGRVIGVNTFVRSGTVEDHSDRMHYSLGAVSAIEFARQNEANPSVVSGRCVVTPAPEAPRVTQQKQDDAKPGQP